MNLTPQSLRSPVSPYDQQSKQPFSSPRVCYTSSPQSHCASLRNAPSRGLGIFGCSIPSSQNAVHPLPPSPQPSDSWSHSSVMDQDYRQSSQHPDIFSSAFDPFSGFSTSSNTGMNLVNSPEAPGLDYCQTPPSSNMQSHRSSISSSYAPSDSYSQSGSDFMCTPKVKVEDASEWYPSAGNDQVLQRALSARELSSYPNSISPVNAQAADLYRSPPDGWSKSSVPTYTTELHGSPDCRLPRFDPHPILASVARTKKKRQRTTPEEATHECRVCGKLFKRSYNWKSHMETHNPERKYPHPCTAMIENTPCTKKFQRKTDLDRHYDSVSHCLKWTLFAAINTLARCTSKLATINVIYVATVLLAVIR